MSSQCCLGPCPSDDIVEDRTRMEQEELIRRFCPTGTAAVPDDGQSPNVAQDSTCIYFHVCHRRRTHVKCIAGIDPV